MLIIWGICILKSHFLIVKLYHAKKKLNTIVRQVVRLKIVGDVAPGLS